MLPPTALPTIPAEAWNELLAKLAQKLNLVYGGRDERAGFRHPWNVQADFNFAANRWEANVQPGMVNAMETDAPRMKRADAPELTQERLAASADTVPWLSERPWLPVRTEKLLRLGTDAEAFAAAPPVPEFFLALGVLGPPQVEFDLSGFSGVTVAPPSATDPDSIRLLRSVDFVLSIPKPTAAPVLVDNGRGGMDLAPGLQAAPGGNPSIHTTRLFVPEPDAPSLQEQLVGGRPDPSTLKLHLARLYLLSPFGAAHGSEPDHTWAPLVAHHYFYNLAFSFAADIDELPPLNLTLPTGLAGGAADQAIQNQLEELNQADAAASLFLSRAVVRTRVWTV